MKEEFNKKKAVQDLDRWRRQLFDIHKKLNAVYTEMFEVMEDMK